MANESPLTKPEIEELMRRFGDHEEFARESLRIENKRGVLSPMILQPAQLKLWHAIRRQRQRRIPVRICYLKAGQVMVSSGTAAQMFHAVPFLPGRHCLAVADSEQHAELVFRYYKGFQQNYVPFSGGIEGAQITLPELTNDKGEALKWANNSFIQIATGRNPHVGRSAPWQYCQVSEAGFMPTFGTLMDGLMQRVPRTPDTLLVVESTPFGDGGPFYELCQQAQDPQRADEWVFLFFGWWEHPEYVKPLDDPLAFQRDLSREERDEQQRYGLSLEQLNWRRWAIRNNCGGKVEVFRQEFPGNPREAFQSSSRTYLDMGALERRCLIEPGIAGRIEVIEVGPSKHVQFRQQEDEALRVWRHPRKEGIYIIGADSAQGKDPELQAGGRSDPDFASANVLDVLTGEQVATYRARITEAFFARIVHALGWYYNWAFLVPEAVGAGRAFLQALLALEYPVGRIYRRPRAADDMRPPTFNEIGFETSTVTRPQLLSALDTALLEGAITLHDQQTAQECRTLVWAPDGKVGAKAGTHDDTVFSLALAVMGLRYVPRQMRQVQQSPAAPRVTRYGRKRNDNDD